MRDTENDNYELPKSQPYSSEQTQEVKAVAIRQALSGQRALMIRSPDRVDIADVEAVEQAANKYIADCSTAGILPNIEGLCCVLGFSRQWLYQFLKEKPNSESAAFINRLRMAWTSLRISLAERQILSAPTTIFLLKNSGMGFSDVPADNNEAPIQTDPYRPEWAYGMSESEYAEAARKRIDAMIASLPEPEDFDDIPPASYELAKKYLVPDDENGGDSPP
ncbi:MAG: hypothetical protein IJ181_12760 [Acidaminococcaceae bacterium]|nr:hypothetical protein [Acidaminococcaceae bacterium]